MKKRPDCQNDAPKTGKKPNGKRDLHAEQLEPRILYSAAPAEAPAPDAPDAAEAPAAETQQTAPPAPAPEPAPAPVPDATAPAPAPEPVTEAAAPAAETPPAEAVPQETETAPAPAAEAEETDSVLETPVVVLPEEGAAEVGADAGLAAAEEAASVVDEAGNVVVEAAIVAPVEIAANSATIVAPATAQVDLATVSQPQITQQVVEQLAAAASERWHSTGLTADQSQALANVVYELAELSGTKLGVTEGNVITIDATGGDRGWFMDSTPLQNEEFWSGPGEVTMIADPNSDAYDRYDLFSVLLHEHGHILGLGEDYTNQGSVMFAGRDAGQRALPAEGQAEGAVAGSVTEASYVNHNITTLTDGTGATTLRGAIITANSSTTDDTIMLGNGTFTLTLNGGGGTAGQNAGDLDIWKQEGTLIIDGMGAGTTFIDASALANDRVFEIHTGAEVIFRDLTITGGDLTTHGGGLRINNANVTFENVIIEGNKTTGVSGDNHGRRGAGFYVDGVDSIVTVKDTTVRNNEGYGPGAGFFVDQGVIALENVTVDGNKVMSTGQNGGGFYLSGRTEATATGTLTVTNNRASSNAGGFYVEAFSSFDASAATSVSISGNQASVRSDLGTKAGGGGGHGFFATHSAVVKLNNATINNNGFLSDTAGGAGGGFRADDRAKVTITGGSLSGNVGRTGGGGFYANDRTTVSLTNVDITNNKAVNQTGVAGGSGGGFYAVNATTTVTISGGKLEGNTAANNGGGFTNAGTVTISDVTIQNNTVVADGNVASHDNRVGGGFYSIGSSSSVTLTNVDVLNNTANGRGGGFYNDGIVTFTDDTLISGNKILMDFPGRHREGGGFFNAGIGTVDFQGAATITANNSTDINNGGGFYNTNEGLVRFRAGGEISGHTVAANGAGFFNAEAGRVELTKVDIKNNTATTDGGGFYHTGGARGNILDRTNGDAPLAASSVVIDGGSITGNTTTATSGEGGGFYNVSGKISVTNADITSNVSNSSGGGFYSTGRVAEVTITDSSISSNQSRTNGGGFYNNDGTVTVTNTGAFGAVKIDKNQTGAGNVEGGGFYNAGSGVVNITGVQIHENTAARYGGGFTNEYGVVTLEDVTIQKNQSGQHGGGFNNSRDDRTMGTGVVTLKNAVKTGLFANAISGNVTLTNHGGGFSSRGFVRIENADITGNTAGQNSKGGNNYGGGFHAEGYSSRVEVIDSNITGNTAYGRGAGFYVSHGEVLMQSSDGSALEIKGNQNLTTNANTDAQSAGGFWASGQSDVLLKNVDITENKAGGHGVGFVARNEANVTLEGGSLTKHSSAGGRTDAHGAGFYAVERAHVTIKGTAGDKFELTGNTTVNTGGGFYATDQRVHVTLEHVEIEGNTAQTGTGGGFRNNGVLTISDSTVKNNVAANSHGGGFYNQGQILMKTVDITGNRADAANPAGTDERRGGGFYNTTLYSKIVMEDVSIDNNTAHGGGGGFWNDYGTIIGTAGSGTLTITNNVSNNNPPANADNSGGGGFHNRSYGVVELTDVEIKGNSTTGRGGGFYSTTDSSRNVLINATIEDNKSRAGGGGFYVSSAGNQLIIRDSSVDNNQSGVGALTTHSDINTNFYGGGGYVDSLVEISNTTVDGNTMLAHPGNEARDWRGGGLGFGGNADATLTDVSVSNNTAFGIGGGIFNSGKLVATNLTVDGNTNQTANNKSYEAGGIYSAGGSAWLEITGGSVSNNLAHGNAGGLRLTNYAKLTDVTISGNKTLHGTSDNVIGGGFYSSGTGTRIILDNTKVDGNTADGRGGGIYNADAHLILQNGSEVTNNKIEAKNAGGTDVARRGGGIWNSGRGTLEISDGKINNNVSSGEGGGLTIWDAGTSATLTNTEISGNTAFGHGGGFRLRYGVVEGTNVTISDNKTLDAGGGTADRVGGGFYIQGSSDSNNSTVRLADSTISDNVANTRGGGVFVNGGGTLELTNTTVEDNISDGRGGGIYAESNNTLVTLTGSTVTGNQAGYELDGGGSVVFGNDANADGGGIYFNSGGSGTLALLNTAVTNNLATRNGGGVFRANGSVILADSTLTGNQQTADTGPAANDVRGGAVGNYNLVGTNLIAASNPDLSGQPGVITAPPAVTGTAPSGLSITVGANPTAGAAVTLAGAATDGDGASTFAWTVVNAAGVAQAVNNANTANADFIPAVGGRYFASLAVTDSADGDVVTLAQEISVGEQFTIASTADENTDVSGGAGTDTLREAIMRFNDNRHDVTINLGAGTFGLNLGAPDNTGANDDRGDLDVWNRHATLTIIGNGAANTIIDANGLGDRILQLFPHANLVLKDLTFQGGESTEHGGGIRNDQSRLTLENVVFNDNTATSANRQGGAIWNAGTNAEIAMTGVSFTNNQADHRGGGLYNVGDADITIGGTTVFDQNKVLSSNHDREGGGFYNYAGQVTAQAKADLSFTKNSALGGGAGFWNGSIGTIDASAANSVTITGNTAPTRTDGEGAGFDNNNLGQVTLNNATITGNGLESNGRSGGGFHNTNFGQVTITGGEISGNTARDLGGGFRNNIHGDVTLTDVKLQNNTANRGGGFWHDANHGTVTLTETADGLSTLTGNVADTSHGGGFYAEGRVEITHVDITGNTITGTADSRGGGFMLDHRTAHAVLTDVNVTNNTSPSHGGGFNIQRWGTAEFKLDKNATIDITGNKATENARQGGGFRITSGTTEGGGIVILDGAFNIGGNQSGGDGGGFYNGGGLVMGGSDTAASKIDGNVIANTNTSNYQGGGFYQTSGGSVVLKNTSVTANSASGHGGGFYNVQGAANINNLFDQKAGEITDLGSVTIANSKIDGLNISGNTANTLQRNDRDIHGGGFYNDSGKITLTNVDITGNEIESGRTHHGGGFYNATRRAEVLITDGHVTSNIAPDSGAGFYTIGSVTFDLDKNADVQISGNKITETGQGGGFYVVGKGEVTIPEAKITGNTAGSSGGGFNALDRTFVHLTNAEITGNTAGERGGGFRAGNDVNTQHVGKRELDGNGLQVLDANGYAAIQADGQNIRITGTGSKIEGNTAASNGGGFNATNAVYLENTSISNNTATTGQGGGFNADGRTSITIDNSGNGADIKGNKAGSHGGGFHVTDAFLTLKGSAANRVEISGHKLNLDRHGGGFRLANSAVAVVEEIDVLSNEADRYGGGFDVSGDAMLTLTNAKISGNQTTEDNNSYGGGGFYQSGNTDVNLKNVEIEGNTGERRGGGFYQASRESKLTISGTSTIKNNLAQDYEGGGFYSAGYVDITGATIEGNKSNQAGNNVGGGFRATGYGNVLNLTDTDVKNNISRGSGAGGYFSNGQLSIKGTKITGNTILAAGSGNGGGLYTDGNSRVTIENAEITGNTADGHGGGFYFNGAKADLTGVKINNNQALNEAGGLFHANEQGTLTGTNVEIKDNVALNSHGGGVRVSGILNLTDSIISGNEADQNGGGNDERRGGGMHALGNATVTLTDTNVSDNKGGIGAGIHARDNTELTVIGSDPGALLQISGNKVLSSDRPGGGAYFGQNTYATLTNVAIDGNTSTSHGGGFYSDTAAKITGNNVSISNNTVSRADRQGGGFFATTHSQVTLSEAKIEGNKAGQHAGGFYAETATLTKITDSSVSKNQAGGVGGAVRNRGVLFAERTHFDQNTATSAGGAFYMDGGIQNTRAYLTDSTVDGNTTGNRGGAFFMTSSAKLFLNRVTIAENTANGGTGGGVHMENNGTRLYAVNSTFSGNKTTAANSDGGAIYFSVGASNGHVGRLELTHVTITDNTAVRNGGGIHRNNGFVTLSNSIVYGNKAGTAGREDVHGGNNTIELYGKKRARRGARSVGGNRGSGSKPHHNGS